MDAAIRASGVVKSYVGPRPIREVLAHPFRRRRVPALAGVDLEAECGELVALVGPNGAGKTTLLKVLCTLTLPDGGRAELAGHDVAREAAAVRRAVGLVTADERSFYWRLSAREARSRIAGLLARVDLASAADAPFREYSTGMRQKLALCRGLLHAPKVLLLDEPTRGIDLAALRTLRAVLREHVAAGGGALLASHDLAEIEALECRVALLAAGRVAALGSIAELRRALNITETVEIALAGGDPAALAAGLARDPRVQEATAEGERLVVRLAPDVVVGEVIASVQAAGGRVTGARPRGGSLEQVLDASAAAKPERKAKP